MFVCNIKLNKKKLIKLFLFIFIAIALISFMVFMTSNSNKVFVTDSNPYENFLDIAPSNYTNLLKDCNANLDKYVGKKIKFSGFVHRVYDFSDNQFVLGREMVTKTLANNQVEVVVVGFLCEYDKAFSFKDKTWVEVEGTITKGFYHSEIPVVSIENIHEVECPNEPYVYPPDGGYVTQ